jgi:hypothetical protein
VSEKTPFQESRFSEPSTRNFAFSESGGPRAQVLTASQIASPLDILRQSNHGFDKINAPTKHFAWFEDSSHFPFTEEPSKFTDTLIPKVLPIARQSQEPALAHRPNVANRN